MCIHMHVMSTDHGDMYAIFCKREWIPLRIDTGSCVSIFMIFGQDLSWIQS